MWRRPPCLGLLGGLPGLLLASGPHRLLLLHHLLLARRLRGLQLLLPSSLHGLLLLHLLLPGSLRGLELLLPRSLHCLHCLLPLGGLLRLDRLLPLDGLLPLNHGRLGGLALGGLLHLLALGFARLRLLNLLLTSGLHRPLALLGGSLASLPLLLELRRSRLPGGFDLLAALGGALRLIGPQPRKLLLALTRGLLPLLLRG